MKLHQDTLYQIAKNLTYSDLASLCETDPRLERICHDRQFWLLKLRQKRYLTAEDIDVMRTTAIDPSNYSWTYQNILRNRVLADAPRRPGGTEISNALNYAIELNDPEALDVIIRLDYQQALDLALAYTYWANATSLKDYLLQRHFIIKPTGYQEGQLYDNSEVNILFKALADAIEGIYPKNCSDLKQATDIYLENVTVPLQQSIMRMITDEEQDFSDEQKVDCIRYLLQKLRSFDFRHRQYFLDTALREAREHQKDEIAKLLLEEGAVE
jgi:hypothetical protein